MLRQLKQKGCASFLLALTMNKSTTEQRGEPPLTSREVNLQPHPFSHPCAHTRTHMYATLPPLHNHAHTPPHMPSFAFTEVCKPSLGTRTCKHLSNNIHCVHVYATQLLSTHLCKHTLVPPCACTPLVLVNTCALPYLCTPLCTYIHTHVTPSFHSQRSHTHQYHNIPVRTHTCT